MQVCRFRVFVTQINEYLFLLKFLLDSNLPLASCKLLDLFCGWSGSNCNLNSVKNHGKYKMNSKIPIDAIIILKKNCKKISSHQKSFSKRLYSIVVNVIDIEDMK